MNYKTNTMFYFFAALLGILFLTGNTLASWYWQEQWAQKWKWNWQAQAQIQQMKTQKESSWEISHSFTVSWILNEAEIERLILQYEDEYAAIWIYNYFYELYGLEVFKNIANSEENHLWAIISLMEAYNLELPDWLSEEFQAELDSLKSMGEWSLKEALEAWVLFEIRDIEDIAKTISLTQNEDIKKVMFNIGGGSFNHLRWFLTSLDKQGFTTDIDYSEFLTEEDLEQKGLKDRFIRYLNNKWINIDETLLNSKDDTDKKWQQKWRGTSWKMQWWGKDEAFKNTQRQRKEFFRGQIDRQLWERIRSMNTEALQWALVRIEDMRNDTTISEARRYVVAPALSALEELVSEILLSR